MMEEIPCEMVEPIVLSLYPFQNRTQIVSDIDQINKTIVVFSIRTIKT